MMNQSGSGARYGKRKALTQALRLASANYIASTIAHDISQPLTAINAWASSCLRLAQAEEIPRERLIERMTHLQSESWRATEIVRDFRRHLPRKEPAPAELDLNATLRAIYDILREEAAEPGVELTLQLEDHLPPARADGEIVELAVYILFQNSLEALASRTGTNKNITVRSRRSGAAEVEVEVTDTGPGLDKETGELLFRPFVTGRDGGIGLGLAICRNAIESLGGRIWVEPCSGGGATFAFALPCVPNGGGDGRER